MLEEADEHILAFYAFPADHRRKIRSSKPLDRFTAKSAGAPTSPCISPTTRARSAWHR